MGSVISGLFGGLLGGGQQAPAPTQVIRQAAPQKEKEDPNKSSQVAEARKRRSALAKRTGRSALRIDLANGERKTRTGISIQ